MLRFSLTTQKIAVSIGVCTLFLFASFSTLHALTVDELKQQISTKQKEKAALDAENLRLQAQIDQTNKQAKTLQGDVKVLDTTQKKLQNDIKVTQNKIKTTELSIQKLSLEINSTANKIEKNKNAMGEALRALNRTDEETIIQSFLQYKNLSEVWNGIETIRQFQNSMKQKTDELLNLNNDLKDKKDESEENKKDLTDLTSELGDRKKIVDLNKQVKVTSLAVTKEQESAYRKKLAENIERGKQFEQELFQFESQLKAQIDISKIPVEQGGVLGWPVDIVRITQRFGKTVDAKRLYVSGTHNGVDFGIPVGTQVKSVSAGIVKGYGNTDDEVGCYSYGRWLLIEHPNGLSSMYAHLSAVKVSVGQNIARGEVIGYSGGQPGMSGSGYSTGPHLHLGLFASEGVTIQKYTQSKFCKQVSIPVAEGLNAYLDPLGYLPAN